MARRQEEVRVGGSSVLVVDTVFGLEAEADVVDDALEGFDPDAVALGVSPSELDGLDEYLAASGEPPTPEPDRYAEGLAEFGAISLPPPSLLAAVSAARARDLPLEALDLPEEAYTETFTDQVSTWQLFWNTRREKKLARNPPDVATAREYALAWDRERRRSDGLAHLEAKRELHMADRLRELAGRHHRVLAVVETPRAAGVVEELDGR